MGAFPPILQRRSQRLEGLWVTQPGCGKVCSHLCLLTTPLSVTVGLLGELAIREAVGIPSHNQASSVKTACFLWESQLRVKEDP